MNASRYSIICLVNFIPGTYLNTGKLSSFSIIGASSPPTIPGRGSFTGNVDSRVDLRLTECNLERNHRGLYILPLSSFNQFGILREQIDDAVRIIKQY
jgi:hypothetical protein